MKLFFFFTPLLTFSCPLHLWSTEKNNLNIWAQSFHFLFLMAMLMLFSIFYEITWKSLYFHNSCFYIRFLATIPIMDISKINECFDKYASIDSVLIFMDAVLPQWFVKPIVWLDWTGKERVQREGIFVLTYVYIGYT